MKVLAVNGSPHEKGCTFTALRLMADELEKEGIEVEIVHIGTKPIRGCIDCRSCKKAEDSNCAFDDDIVNELIEKSRSVNGIILGSPVHFSGMAGQMKCFLDRFFFTGGRDRLRFKVGMAVVTARRSGGTAAFDQLNHYLTYGNLVVATSHYWNVVHGTTPDEVLQDKEGVQIVQTAARNMAWIIKSIEHSKIAYPKKEQQIRTNFIR